MNLEARLDGWGEWARRSGRTRRSAQSLEGEWRSPQPWDAPPPTALIAVNVDDCRQIELAWSTLDPQDKVFLRTVYCKRYGRKRVLELTGFAAGKELRYHHWLEVREHAHTAIERAINRGEAKNHDVLRELGRAVLGITGMRCEVA